MKTLLKTTLYFLFILLAASCKKSEDNDFTVYKFKVAKLTQEADNFRLGGLSSTEIASIKGEANISVKFYTSEIDARTDKNLAFEKTTDGDGFVEIQKKFSGPAVYYVMAASGEFNYLRGGDALNSLAMPSDVLFLTLTPSRLQIQVLNISGTPIPGANVAVYPSEDDYIKNVIGGSSTLMNKFPEYGGHGNTTPLIKTSDATGTVKFENLAPRIFWFRVTGPVPYKNNDGGYYKLAAPLPDSPEIYFVTSVILKQ